AAAAALLVPVVVHRWHAGTGDGIGLERAECSSGFDGGNNPLAKTAAAGRGVFSRILVDFQFVLLQGELSGVPAPVASNVDRRFCHTRRHRTWLRRPGDLQRRSTGGWIRLAARYGVAWQSSE